LLAGRRIKVLGTDRYREIWLARPERRNALDVLMRDELHSTVTAIVADRSVTAVALFGEGPDFCSGGDLDEFGLRGDVARAWQIRLLRSLPSIFSRLAPRLFAGIQGSAIGAGIELAAFAHRVVCSEQARFRLPEVGFGLIPGSGGTISITRRIGRRRTFEMALSGAWITSTQALAWGLVDEVAPAGALVTRVREVAT
jgi:enoyl-CoA hydratase/carnithine racemase